MVQYASYDVLYIYGRRVHFGVGRLEECKYLGAKGVKQATGLTPSPLPINAPLAHAPSCKNILLHLTRYFTALSFSQFSPFLNPSYEAAKTGGNPGVHRV